MESKRCEKLVWLTKIFILFYPINNLFGMLLLKRTVNLVENYLNGYKKNGLINIKPESEVLMWKCHGYYWQKWKFKTMK